MTVRVLVTSSLALSLVPSLALAASWGVAPSDAVFAIVTKKEGVASGFAHDHVVVAKQFTVDLQGPEGEPEKGTFRASFPVASLSVDAPEDQRTLYPKLHALGVQKAEFSSLSEGDRAKVKENALSEDQLDAKGHPEVSAQVTKLERSPFAFNGKSFTHSATVKLTVKGKSVEKKLPANVTIAGKEMTVECVGPFAFSEFGIKPYSAMLGAVRNADPFHLYVAFTARAQ